jgi:hypothetical protein
MVLARRETTGQSAPHRFLVWDRSFADSLLEEGGFEPSVPLRNLGTLQLHSGLLDPMIATDNGRQGFTGHGPAAEKSAPDSPGAV